MVYSNFTDSQELRPGKDSPEVIVNKLNYKKLLAGNDFVLSLKLVV
jgi:hypothetical protein